MDDAANAKGAPCDRSALRGSSGDQWPLLLPPLPPLPPDDPLEDPPDDPLLPPRDVFASPWLLDPLLPDDALREREPDSMSLSASSPIRSVLSLDDPRELPDDPLLLDDPLSPPDEPLAPPRVAELPMPSSPMLPRSVRLLPEDPPEPLLLDAPLCEEPDRPAASKPPPCCDAPRLDCEPDEPDDPLPDDPLIPPCELWSFSRSAMVCSLHAA